MGNRQSDLVRTSYNLIGGGAVTTKPDGVSFSPMKDPAFLFYPGDYLRDTQCLSEKAQVAYDRIMCEHMRNICISQSQLDFFTKRLSEPEKDELCHVLTKVRGGFQIGWVAESIEKRRKYSESRRKNREGKKKEHMLSYDSHMENENVIENNINGTTEKKSDKDNIETMNKIFGYLSKKTGGNYQARVLRGRLVGYAEKLDRILSEGFTPKQVMDVVIHKCTEWGEDEKMKNHLKPNTLFDFEKFTRYIDEVPEQIRNRPDGKAPKQKTAKDDLTDWIYSGIKLPNA